MRMVFHRCEFFDAASDLNHSKEFFHRWYMQQTWQATELNIGTWFYVLQQTNVATLYNLQFNDISKSKRKWKLLFKYLLCFVWLGWFGSFAKVREMIWAIFRHQHWPQFDMKVERVVEQDMWLLVSADYGQFPYIFRHASVSSTYPCPCVRLSVGR